MSICVEWTAKSCLYWKTLWTNIQNIFLQKLIVAHRNRHNLPGTKQSLGSHFTLAFPSSFKLIRSKSKSLLKPSVLFRTMRPVKPSQRAWRGGKHRQRQRQRWAQRDRDELRARLRPLRDDMENTTVMPVFCQLPLEDIEACQSNLLQKYGCCVEYHGIWLLLTM